MLASIPLPEGQPHHSLGQAQRRPRIEDDEKGNEPAARDGPFSRVHPPACACPPQCEALGEANRDRTSLLALLGIIRRDHREANARPARRRDEIPKEFKVRSADSAHLEPLKPPGLCRARHKRHTFGSMQAEANVTDMILHKRAVVVWDHRGRYRRIIGTVFAGKENTCHYLVAQGFARRYSRTPRTSVVASLEAAAKKQHRGLWKIVHP